MNATDGVNGPKNPPGITCLSYWCHRNFTRMHQKKDLHKQHKTKYFGGHWSNETTQIHFKNLINESTLLFNSTFCQAQGQGQRQRQMSKLDPEVGVVVGQPTTTTHPPTTTNFF